MSMHRRTVTRGKSSSSPPPSPPLEPDAEKSKLNQRNLGVTNRIWLIVGLFLAILGFTHFFFPSAPVINPRPNANLKPKNYLNESKVENPFDFCPSYGPGDELSVKYGNLVIAQSRLHLGSGARVQRVLQRALAGQPVTISIVGGSGMNFDLRVA